MPTPSSASRDHVLFAQTCFFATGCSALVLETTWNQLLPLTLGSATTATTAVLIAMLGGLGLGAWIIGRRLHASHTTLWLFGAIEMLLGLFALTMPTLLTRTLPAVQAAAWPLLGGAPVAMAALRFILALSVLLVPTLLMGTSLPVLSQALVRRQGEVGRRVGALYAANTFGAVCGTLLAGFALLPLIGAEWTNRLAALLDLGIGALVLAVGWSERQASDVAADVEALRVSTDRRAAPTRRGGTKARFVNRGASTAKAAVATAVTAPTSPPTTLTRGARRIVLLGLILAGAVSLLLELAFLRALPLVVGPSVDAFALMLATFLAGLALGGAWLARRADALVHPLRTLGVLYSAAALAIMCSVAIYPRLFTLYLWLFGVTDAAHGGSFWATTLPAVAAMAPATFFLGAAFPLAIRLLARAPGEIGGEVGRAYLAGTLGNIVGALATGLVFIPLLGVRACLLIGAALLLAGSAACFAWAAPRRRAAVTDALAIAALGGLTLALAPAWDAAQQQLGVAVYAEHYLDSEGLFDAERYRTVLRQSRAQLVFRREGRDADVAVFDDRATRRNVMLKVNGKIDGSTVLDMPTQIFSGALPAAYVPAAKNVLVIGFGTGVTVSALLELTDAHVTVLEIERAVLEAGHYFAEANRNVLDEPRWRGRLELVVDDARGRLAADPATYDIIVSEPSNPWMAGTANLFSTEFFELVRSRLSPSGVFVSWLQAYNLYYPDLASVYRGLFETFAATHTYNFSADLVTVASATERALPVAAFAGMWQQPSYGEYLVRFGCAEADWLLAQYVGNRAELLAAVGDGPSVHDLHTTLAANAARALFADTLGDNLRRLHAEARGAVSILAMSAVSDAQRSRIFGRLASYASAPARRDVFLSEALFVAQPAAEALLAACRAQQGDGTLAGLAGPACRAAYAQSPNDPAVLFAFGAWLGKFRCADAVPVLTRVVDDERFGGEARYLRAACALEHGKTADGLRELAEVAVLTERWPRPARAADALLVTTWVELADAAALDDWTKRHPRSRDPSLDAKVAEVLGRVR